MRSLLAIDFWASLDFTDNSKLYLHERFKNLNVSLKFELPANLKKTAPSLYKKIDPYDSKNETNRMKGKCWTGTK